MADGGNHVLQSEIDGAFSDVSHRRDLLDCHSSSSAQAPQWLWQEADFCGAGEPPMVNIALGSTNRINEILRLGKVRRKLSATTPSQIRRIVMRAWRAMLGMRVEEALELLSGVEPSFGDLAPAAALEMRIEVNLLRALGLTLQDNCSAAHLLAAPALSQSAHAGLAQMASTICRLGHWKNGQLEQFHALPRIAPGSMIDKRQAIHAAFDLSIEAAVEVEQLRFASARRLALDALQLTTTLPPRDQVMAAFPACVVAQLLYEQGYLDEAEAAIRDRLATIKGSGSIESALRAYLVLAKIAACRGAGHQAEQLLGEAEALGEKRGWVRLMAASLGERADLLIAGGRIEEANGCVAKLDRLCGQHHGGDRQTSADVHGHFLLARCAVALARAAAAPTLPPSASALEAVAAIRHLHFEAVNKRDLYRALQLAVRMADALELIGESEEAIANFTQALKFGSAVGLYQVFADGGPRIGRLLAMVYARAQAPGDELRELLPYVGSLLNRWRLNERLRATPRPIRRVPAEAVCAHGFSAAGAGQANYAAISAREREILHFISRGLSNKGIAKTLKIAPETVKSHAKHIFVKLAVKTRAEAVSRAGALGLV